jgi:predicted outer membrane repeat protein
MMVGLPAHRALHCAALLMLGAAGLAWRQAPPAGAAPAGEFVVANTLDSGPGSLRQALLDTNASPGADAIHISAHGTVLLASALPVITDAVSLLGPGMAQFAVDGQDLFRVLDIGSVNVTVSDLTIQRGYVAGPSANGAGIRSTGRLWLSNVAVLSSTAESHGGGLHATAAITVSGSTFRGNQSTGGIGGGLRSASAAVISDTAFIENTSHGDGGGAFALGGLALSHSLFQANRCLATSCDGGGMFSFGTPVVEHTHFISNTAQDQGGGASINGTVAISHALFERNTAVWGTGGGMYLQGTAAVTATSFLSNTARSHGGGLYSFADAMLFDVLFQGNASTLALGGGLRAGSSVSVERGQFIGNSALEGGGLSHSLGDARLVNSLFAANTAASAQGMAMLFGSAGSAEVLHVTVVGAAPAVGTAIEVRAGTAGITNTIITRHAAGLHASAGLAHQDYNLFFENDVDVQGGVSGGANSRSANPVFASPVDGDYRLGPGSAAVDAGIDAGMVDDFKGAARPQGGGFDIGFDEAAPQRLFLPLVVR